MRFEEVYGGWQKRGLTQEEAARVLGVCRRTFRRLVDRYEESGLEMLRKLPRGFPKMHVFRRDKGGGGQAAAKVFGKNIFYDTWKAACANLGIEDIDLYGGTRHSSAVALRQHLSPEGIRRLTDHETNKAFERHYMRDLEECRAGYALTRCNTSATPIDGESMRANPHEH